MQLPCLALQMSLLGSTLNLCVSLHKYISLPHTSAWWPVVVWSSFIRIINVNIRKANNQLYVRSRFLGESTDSSREHRDLIHTYSHTINAGSWQWWACMGKCTGFPQGHQGPEGFNWDDQILLPFSSSSPSPASDNGVCILMHLHVTHSVSQSVSEPAGIFVVGGACNSQMGFFLLPIKYSWLLALSRCFLLVCKLNIKWGL